MTAKSCFIFFISFSAIILLSCKNPVNCDSYKNGNFYYYSALTKDKIVVERKDGIQIERNLTNGNIEKSKIVWKGPCEFELTPISVNWPIKDTTDSFLMQTPVEVKIISAGRDFYIYKARIDSFDKYLELVDTMRLLK